MIRCINKAGFTSSVNLSFEADWPRATIDDGRIASVMKDALNCKVAGYTPPKGGTSHDACDPDYLNILDFFTNAGLQDKLKRDRNVFKFWGGESVVGATWGINSPKLAETRFYYDPAGKYRVTVIVEGTAGIPSISAEASFMPNRSRDEEPSAEDVSEMMKVVDPVQSDLDVYPLEVPGFV